MSAKYKDSQTALESCQKSENELRLKSKSTEKSLEKYKKSLAEERKISASRTLEAQDTRKKILKIKGEKNSFKQKADSLAKEMSRICKNGLGIKDIEKLMHDHKVIKTEVNLLTAQKRKALEQLHHYKSAYENSVLAQEKAGMNKEAMRALEQRVQLERVVDNMTEYLNAKEMQLETMREVNQTLTEEIRMLGKTNRAENDV